MRRFLWPAVFVVLLLPAVALGAQSTRTVLDFTKPGPLRTYFELTMAVAQSYLALAVILAVTLEAVGHAPGTPRNFAAVVWRIVIVLFLLWNYERVFGFVIRTTDDIADRLSPADALDEFHKYMDTVYEAKEGASQAPAMAPEVEWATGEGKSAAEAPGRSSLGSYVFDALMGVLLFAAKGLVYGLERLARILTAVFFILGPLALVAGIPRPSGTAEKWFRHFVTVAAWPIFSGVLLGVMTAVAKQSVANGAGTTLGNLVAAVVMGLCALAAPVLSGWIVGGTAQNLAGLGHASFESSRRAAAQVVTHVKAMLPSSSSDGRKPGPSEANGRGEGMHSRGRPGGGTPAGRLGAVGSNPPTTR